MPLLRHPVSVLVVNTFGSDSADPTKPMSLPNYSDPLVANWSTGRDAIIVTPSIFDSAVEGLNEISFLSHLNNHLFLIETHTAFKIYKYFFLLEHSCQEVKF